MKQMKNNKLPNKTNRIFEKSSVDRTIPPSSCVNTDQFEESAAQINQEE
jgi:hypothetical protein